MPGVFTLHVQTVTPSGSSEMFNLATVADRINQIIRTECRLNSTGSAYPGVAQNRAVMSHPTRPSQ